jgi:recombinase
MPQHPHRSDRPQGRRSVTPQDLAQLIMPLFERLDRILALLERLEAVGTSQGRTAAPPQRHTAETPQGRTAAARRRDAAVPAAAAAYQRMLALQGEGLTLQAIAERLTAEGYRTMRGRPWHKSTVSYVLRTHGR